MSDALGNARKVIKLNKKSYKIRFHEDPINQLLYFTIKYNIRYTYNTFHSREGAMRLARKGKFTLDGKCAEK